MSLLADATPFDAERRLCLLVCPVRILGPARGVTPSAPCRLVARLVRLPSCGLLSGKAERCGLPAPHRSKMEGLNAKIAGNSRVYPFTYWDSLDEAREFPPECREKLRQIDQAYQVVFDAGDPDKEIRRVYKQLRSPISSR